LPWLPWNINNPNPQFSKAHLTTLNLNNFKMIEGMGLKILLRGPLEWLHLPTDYHEDLPSISKVISWGTHRQTDKLVI
jgi:hypothetical protein